jgi:simple sugar transport system substrate-binding protein
VPAELTVIEGWATGHPSAKGMFAVDAGSTQGLAQTIQKQGLKAKGWVGGGYDLTPITEQLLAAGYIEFTIDQQPYLQGFFPILELYLYNASQGLTGIADVDTGLKFLNKTTVVPYSSTKSVYEGTGTQPGVQKS